MDSNEIQGNTQPYNTSLIEYLVQLSQSRASGCLQITASEIKWKLHFYHGSLVYASDNIAAWDRLERLLRFLGCQPLPQVLDAHSRSPHSFIDTLDLRHGEMDSIHQVANWLLQQQYISPKDAAALIETWTQPNFTWSQDPTYQAIYWLANQKVLTQEQLTNLNELLIKEVLELLLVAEDHRLTFSTEDQLSGLPQYSTYKIEPLLNTCLQRLKRWQTLAPAVWSPYQRPYFFSQSDKAQQLSPELKQRLGSMLRGFSFRHLAAALKKDDIQLAQSLQTYIQQGIVFLREPREPFDQLPRIPEPKNLAFPDSVETHMSLGTAVKIAPSDQGLETSSLTTRSISEGEGLAGDVFKIACVDDSLAMLNEITRLLGNEQFSVTAINNPVRALMQIVRVQPNLVLLDVGMPGMDGYELCRLLRNHPLFEKTPVIMVTGHTGIIDRARAKLVGATDYLTKPFTKEGLLKIVTKHLAVTV